MTSLAEARQLVKELSERFPDEQSSFGIFRLTMEFVE